MAQPPAPEPEVSPIDKIAALPSFADAIAATLPLMTDSENDISPGAVALAAWGAKDGHMKWGDIGVPKDETSFALVQKDSDEERGKRYCASGRLIQIAVDKTRFGKLYGGLLMDNSRNLWAFTAVGSTGSLVEMSWARFCGVVVGRYNYSNSGGGTGHAIRIVGMFDLPDNKR